MKDKTIYIKNIYYMLSYAFKVLKREDYERISPESFQSAENLFAMIIYKGASQIIKQGLYKEYVFVNDNINTVKGKVNTQGTIKNRINRIKTVNCDFDELSENNIYNQIIYLTINCLYKCSLLRKELKEKLKKCLIRMQNIELIEMSLIKWNKLVFHNNNKIYEMMINICYFVLTGMIQTENKGKYKVVRFSEEKMEKVYERFILEYYRQNYKGKIASNAEQISWNVDGQDKQKNVLSYWTTMQTDVTLKKDDKVLIIDAKYYSKIFDYRFSKKYHSYNLYQIYSYVKNYDKNKTGKVVGILLYAKTDEDVPTSEPISIDGNVFCVEVLDLYQNFDSIKKQLDNLITKYLDN